jgi:hypothetical protein
MHKKYKKDWAKVKSYDISELARLYADRYNHPISHVLEVAEETKKYLFITKHRNPEVEVAMSGMDIDYFWHFWLFCTPEYNDFCTNYLGKWVGHNPVRWWDNKETEGVPHHNTPLEYERIFGERPKEYLWFAVPPELTDNVVMPGAVSFNAKVLIPGGVKQINDISVDDEIINTFGLVSKVRAISSWATSPTQKYIKFPNYDWFMSDNVPLLVSNRAICHNPQRYRDSLTTPVELSLGGTETATLVIDTEKAFSEPEAWKGSGIVDYTPALGTFVYTLYTDAGFRIKGGLNIMSPAL